MSKNERLELSVARALSDIIPTLKDPRIPLVVTVERVNLSKDGKAAKVLITTLDTDDQDELMDALDSAKGFIQGKLAANLNTRFTPKLSFYSNLLDVLT